MPGIARDLKLDPETGDLVVEGGDLVLLSGAEAVVQAIRQRLQFFKGEWFLDLTAGLPYYQEILVKNPNATRLASLFRTELLTTPGVKTVVDLTLTFDRSARSLVVSYTAETDVGQITSTEVL